MFRLGSFSRDGAPFAGLVFDHGVVPLSEAVHHARAPAAKILAAAQSVADLLSDWQRSFDALQEVTAVIQRGESEAIPVGSLRVLPPVVRPGKILNAAANYRAHAEGMRKVFSGGAVDMKKDYGFDKSKGRPYMFLRASSTISGAFDPIVLPAGIEKVDWEAELGAVIGPAGRHVPVKHALDHVAGFVVTNDVSCRDLTWREDRPALRSDWLAGKSFDSFAPTGPYFTPSAFIPDYRALTIRLWVNGDLKQDGIAGDMIFTLEEQIEYASRMMTLEPGDLLATGTPAGTGQERGEFLKAGDVVEAEIPLLGRQKNPVVAEKRAYHGVNAPPAPASAVSSNV